MAEVGTTPIVALDVPTSEAALGIVELLGDSCEYYKVGSELFTAAGPAVVSRLRDLGKSVFLDLKFHDIPNTVAGAVRSAVAHGARLLTVHAVGGLDMLRAARDAAGSECGVLGVTVLTSASGAGIATVWGRGEVDLPAEVLRLAGLCREGGLHGVVCSGLEAGLLRARFGPELATLVPGIRFADGPTHDQARVVTPEMVRAAGARYAVLGRAVTGASDPRLAMAAVHEALTWGQCTAG